MSIRPIDPNRPTAIPAKRITALPPGDNPPARRRRAATGVDAEPEPIVPDPVHPLAAEEPQPDPLGEPAPKPGQRRGHARRNADGKFEPTGDYPAGFARPPVHTRFDGSKPGPGRPKGLRSQASYLREALDETLTLTENGIQRKIKKRQAAAKIFVKSGLENPDKQVMLKLLIATEK